MMAKNVYHAYRVLRPEQLDELNPKIMKIKGTFCHRGEYLPMNLEESTVCAGEYTIEAEAWNPRDCSCTVDIQLDIDTKGIRSLFEGPCRITGTDSVLGVALLWNVIRGTTGVNNCQVMPVDISLDMADSGIISCKDSVSFPEDYLAGDCPCLVFCTLKSHLLFRKLE